MAAPSENPSPEALEALMLFYRDAGVDCMIEAAPVDRFAETAEAAKAKSAPARAAAGMSDRPAAAPGRTDSIAARGADQRPQEPGRPLPGRGPEQKPSPAPQAALQSSQLTVPDEAAFADARALAAGASTIAELRAALESFTGCNLRHSARTTVFADGNPEARLMIVGEAPGRDEDFQGLPFVGRAGQLLDRMLASIGLDRTTAYITNVIPWRPPGNRTPAPHEIELCRPFVERHIELAAPKALLLLGNVAVKTLLQTDRGILSIRGNFTEYRRGDLSVPAMPTLHPAYLLRSPAQKRYAWTDLQNLARRLEADGGS